MNKRKNLESTKKSTKSRKTTSNKIYIDEDCGDDCDIHFIYTNINDDNNDNDDNNLNVFNYETKCESPLCDHIFDLNFVHNVIHKEIENINDLIEYGKLYHCKNFKLYKGIDLKILFDLIQPLTELSNLIGMKEVKENMVNQILFFLQKLNQKEKCMTCNNCILSLECKNINKINEEMLHTVITGPPGTGKTELGKILGKVYKSMGILTNGKFNIATRSDLIAKYLGQTAIKTQEFINRCEGGVMFIDEAYALGNPDQRDSFSKECLDTLNQNLTEKRNFLCVIAGYENALESSFFSFNEGLKRRFSFKYNISGYDGEELKQMFLLRIKNENWEYIGTEKDLVDFFKTNKDKFPRFGGDIETLFLKTKISHSRRIMFKDEKERKKITIEDIKKGFNNFSNHRESKKEEIPQHLYHMYT